MTTECPRCHHVRQPQDIAPQWQCPACGVAYVKATPPRELADGPTAVTDNSAPTDEGPPTKVALLICGVLLLLKGATSGWSLVGALFLFPAFLMLVSALSVTGRWDLYQWERRSGRFVRYDSEEFPGRARLWQAVSVLALAFFLACFALYDPVKSEMSWQYRGSAEATTIGFGDPLDPRPHE